MGTFAKFQNREIDGWFSARVDLTTGEVTEVRKNGEDDVWVGIESESVDILRVRPVPSIFVRAKNKTEAKKIMKKQMGHFLSTRSDAGMSMDKKIEAARAKNTM